MDVTLLAFLILLNGVFAMSELALTASRRARLQVMVESGQPGAQAAMDLHDSPTQFLSTVQIGITSIGVLNGIVGESAFAQPLSHWLMRDFGMAEGLAAVSATALVVVIITVLTIIFGELVPKRVGQLYPETVARLVARPMNWLSTATRPLVLLLSASTNGVLAAAGHPWRAGIMLLLGRLPATGDVVEWDNWRFEVVDLDGKRVDKVLVTPLTNPGEEP
jgi:putative hemolysin